MSIDLKIIQIPEEHDLAFPYKVRVMFATSDTGHLNIFDKSGNERMLDTIMGWLGQNVPGDDWALSGAEPGDAFMDFGFTHDAWMMAFKLRFAS